MQWKVAATPEAEAELLALPKDMQARFLHIAELLETFGPTKVGMPHVRSLAGRCKSTGHGTMTGVDEHFHADIARSDGIFISPAH